MDLFVRAGIKWERQRMGSRQGDQHSNSHLLFLAPSSDASGFLGSLKIPQTEQERQ